MKLTDDYFKARSLAGQWLNREPKKRDFNEGVSILTLSGYKPVVCAKIAKQGDRPHTRQKLEYEMRQMMQVYYHPSDPRFQDVDISDDAQHGSDGIPDSVPEEQAQAIVALASAEAAKESDEQTVPECIAKVIYLFADLYKKRSILHRSLQDCGESNDEETVHKRKDIVKEISSLSEWMGRLAKVSETYEKDGTIPDKETLDKALSKTIEEESDDDSKDDVKKNVYSTDLSTLSVEELKKLKANANTRLCRARNMLLYSSEKQTDKENPLPDCPKRVKYEKKVEQETALIERIDYRLAELG